MLDEQERREAIEGMLDEQEHREAMKGSVHDHALQLLLDEAMEESVRDNSLQLLLDEVVCACPRKPLQTREAQIPYEFTGAQSSSDSRASSSTAPSEDSSPNNESRTGKEGGEGNEDSRLMKQLCGICLEEKCPSEFFDNRVCSHRFCCTCITLHICNKSQENLVPIALPESDNSEHLSPEQCEVILPKQTSLEDMSDEQEHREAMEDSVHDHALQLLLDEALKESVHDNSLQLLLEEVVCACPRQPLQTKEAQIPYEFAGAHSSSDSSASSSTVSSEDSSPNNESRIGKEGVEGNEDSPVMKQLCGICLEEKFPSEFFDNRVCSHRFCCTCITLHICNKLQENLVSIDCPEPDCREHLMAEHCVVILPKQTFEQWSLALVEAGIPPSQKVYCPFRNCSALLLKDAAPDEVACSSEAAAVVNKESECPQCRGLFCAQCGVPWHAGLDCSELQKLSDSEKEEGDLMLFKLAKENGWQRCASCKHIIEINLGCCHMTCRCGYQFCYKCGLAWKATSCHC